MNAGSISSQSLGLTMGQQRREAQNQELWQQQLENASLWKTNLAITTFKSKNPFLNPSGFGSTVSEGSHFPTGQFPNPENEGLLEYAPDRDKHQQVKLNHAESSELHTGDSNRLVAGNDVINPQYNGKASTSVDKSMAEAFGQRVKSVLSNELEWQKKHIFMSDIDGIKQVWIRDSALTKSMTSKLASTLLGSMSQLGVELSRVTVNGQVIFENNHGIKE